jgi:hypothetical protein
MRQLDNIRHTNQVRIMPDLTTLNRLGSQRMGRIGSFRRGLSLSRGEAWSCLKRVRPVSSLQGWRWFVCLLTLCCSACSGSKGLNTVQGKVFYKDQPLKGAVVTFHPKGVTDLTTIRPVGLTSEDGSFTLSTGKDEGAPAGEYVVTFICSEEVGSKGGKREFSTAPPQTQDRLQGAYSNADLSAFTVEIKKGANQLEPFRLK